MAENTSSMQNQALVNQLNSLNQSISKLITTLQSSFPQASASLSGSAGSVSGQYLTVTIGSTAYKIQLLDQ